MRDEIGTQDDDPESNRFLRASRELLEDSSQHYKKFTLQFLGSFYFAVHSILKLTTFEELVESHGKFLIQEESVNFVIAEGGENEKIRFGEAWAAARGDDGVAFRCHYRVSDDTVFISDKALEQFRESHFRVRAVAG